MMYVSSVEFLGSRLIGSRMFEYDLLVVVTFQLYYLLLLRVIHLECPKRRYLNYNFGELISLCFEKDMPKYLILL